MPLADISDSLFKSSSSYLNQGMNSKINELQHLGKDLKCYPLLGHRTEKRNTKLIL